METEEDRRAKLENGADSKRLRLAMEMEEDRKARLENMVTGRKKSNKKKEWIWFRLDFKNIFFKEWVC